MSRLGKKIIAIPEKTQVSIADNMLVVKGPLGELKRTIVRDLKVEVLPEGVKIEPTRKSIEALALWGTLASHLMNMIDGVNKPFEKKLVVEGIGFRSEVRGNKLVLNLGFSHPVEVEIPAGLTVKAENNEITVSGIDKDAVGQFTAVVRSIKKPEPYKGKGIRYATEVIRRKQGKKAV